ncbi:MAG: hypothetical protein AAGJ73_08260 [Pseudomonadota bacterium]
MEAWVASLNIEPWVSTVLVYLLGIATGYLLFGGRAPAAANGDDAIEAIADGATQADVQEGASADGDDKAEKPAADDRETAKALFSSAKTKNNKNGSPPNGDPAPNSMKLGALESELRKAHEMLASADESQEGYEAQLDALEQALKRANGRLKLVMKAVKKAKPKDA